MNLDRFYAHGFDCLRSVLPKDIITATAAYLTQEVQQVTHRLSCYFETDLSAVSTLSERLAEAGRLDRVPKEIKHLLSGQFGLEVRLSEQIRQLLLHPNLVALMQSIKPCQRMRIHMPPMVRFVHPNASMSAVPAHQDLSYSPHLTQFVSIWIPFTPIKPPMGGVIFYQGAAPLTQLLTHLSAQDQNQAKDYWIEGTPVPMGFEPKTFELALGDLLIFDPYVLHESAPNTSSDTRLSLDIRFFSGAVAPGKHALDIETGAVPGLATIKRGRSCDRYKICKNGRS